MSDQIIYKGWPILGSPDIIYRGSVIIGFVAVNISQLVRAVDIDNSSGLTRSYFNQEIIWENKADISIDHDIICVVYPDPVDIFCFRDSKPDIIVRKRVKEYMIEKKSVTLRAKYKRDHPNLFKWIEGDVWKAVLFINGSFEIRYYPNPIDAQEWIDNNKIR